MYPDDQINTLAGEDTYALSDFRAFRANVVAKSSFTCTPIPFADSREWYFENGILRHRSGGFFKLAGLRVQARTHELDGQEQLIILQPETAINGFLLRQRDDGCEILFQGRVEPGNIDAMQLAPTVQSTEANYKRVHGGGPTAFLEWFVTAHDAPALYDELQSEEATRYYGKYNRNVVIDVSRQPDQPLPENFRWYGIDAIRSFAVADNVLNTDARSVLAGLDWRFLAEGGRPFARHPAGSFGARLARSHDAGADLDDASDVEVLAWLTRLRVRSSPRHTVLPLDALSNWNTGADVIEERTREHGFCARQYAVHAEGREVAAWDQPLIDSDGVGRLVLAMQERAGVLRVLVKASHEIGFLEGVQCGASVTIVPGEAPAASDPVEEALLAAIDDSNRVQVLHRCRQSEEGGRFYHDENDYEIVELDSSLRVPDSPFYRWMTLAQVRRLISIPGTFSMEFRGVLALLLHYV
ncbi:MAG: NDP-hexose 2,3-dehydratase family protein [Pseudomonadota bacterium]